MARRFCVERPDVGDDAAGERAALRDIGARAGVERARAEVDVAQAHRAAVVDALPAHLGELRLPGHLPAVGLQRARQVEAAEHALGHREVAFQPPARAQLGRLDAAHGEAAGALAAAVRQQRGREHRGVHAARGHHAVDVPGVAPAHVGGAGDVPAVQQAVPLRDLHAAARRLALHAELHQGDAGRERHGELAGVEVEVDRRILHRRAWRPGLRRRAA